MNNRELVDYILSGNLESEQVIKKIIKEGNKTFTHYWLYNKIKIFNISGQEISLYNLFDKNNRDTRYEIISKEQFNKEMKIKETLKEKKDLETRLKNINKELQEYIENNGEIQF